MLVLSSFTPNLIQAPLEHLLGKFYSESVTLKYTGINFEEEICQLVKKTEKNRAVAILFRLFDLILDGEKIAINKSNLEECLGGVIKSIVNFKKNTKFPLIIFLCPSLYKEDNPPEDKNRENKKILQKCEDYFLGEMQEKKIHTFSPLDIQSYYILIKGMNGIENDAISDIQSRFSFIEIVNQLEGETHIPYVNNYYVSMACLLARKLHCIQQPAYKVIFVDCDYTLWHGVASEGKVEFRNYNLALQKFLVKQKERGVFICLVSKNIESTVNQVFTSQKNEMLLKMSEVVHTRINYDLKSTNIISLLNKLNLGSAKNAMFIDDKESEINEVSGNIPEIFCVLMPQNINDFKKKWAFDIDEYAIVTETDKNRMESAKEDKEIQLHMAEIKDPIARVKFLEGEQPLVIRKLEKGEEKEMPRIESLRSKTNQFNLFKPEEMTSNTASIEEEQKDYFIATVTNTKKSDPTEIEVEGRSEGLVQREPMAVAICRRDSDYLLVSELFFSCREFRSYAPYALIKYIANAYPDLNIIKIRFKKTIENGPAETIIDMLCDEADKNSRVRFLLRNTHKVLFIQASLKYLLKKIDILPIDYNKSLNEEMIFEFPAKFLREMDPYLLVAKTFMANARGKKRPEERLINKDSLLNAKPYLLELEKETQSLDGFTNKFFFNASRLESIPELENRVLMICDSLLGESGQELSLVSRGLNSLGAVQLQASLYESEKVNIDTNKLLCRETTVVKLIECIKDAIKSQNNTKKESLSTSHYSYNQSIPASLQQERLWIAEQKEGITNSSNYHMTACYTISKLDINRFKAACRQLIEQYDVFGAKFSMNDGRLVQSILPPEERELIFIEQNLDQGISLKEAIQKEISIPLSMNAYPLIHIVLFTGQTNEGCHILFHVHHGIFDAISLKNCLDKLSASYSNPLTPNRLQSIESSPQYRKYIDHQQKLLNKDQKVEVLNYWKSKLSKIETITEFPYDQANVTFMPTMKREAERYNFSSSEDDFNTLRSLAQSAGVTSYSVISTLFSLLISAYTYQDKVAMVTAINGRSKNQLFRKMIGFFVNLLVQGFDLEENKDKTFNEYCKDNYNKFLEAQSYQDIPFEEIQNILSEQGIKDILLSPALIYQSYDIPQLILDDELAILTIPERPIIFDLRKFCRFGHFTLFAQEDQATKKLNFVIEYAKDLYSADFIQRIANNFKYLITTVVHNPEQRLKEISVVCDTEREQLLSLGQGPKLKYKVNNLVEGFQSSVEYDRNKIAIHYKGTELTYKKVDQFSNNLAAKLSGEGVGKGDNVGIYCHRNHLFFIAELAILKLGAVFVPLSTENPEDRLGYIIKDAEINCIAGDVDLTEKDNFKKDKSIDLKFIDIQKAMNEETNNDPFVPKEIGREDRACILYTSGSTGNPKGVILKHKGILRVVESPSFVTVNHDDKIAQMANEAFDAAQLECWLAWNHAACLVIIDKEAILSADLFSQQLLGQGITIMWLTAGLFHHYAYNQPDLFKQLNYLLVGGDVIDKQAVQRVLEAQKERSLCIVNGYGPTETSIFALTYTFDLARLNQYDKAPVGRPINNTTVEVLTQFRQLVPIGGVGQLYIGGEGLAEGYLKLPDIEKKCFISDEKMLESRKYKSGDLVKWSVNCLEGLSPEIIFLQRVNNEQRVKIQGNLVFVEEIKNVFLQQPSIKQAEILINEHDKNKFLLAFYTVKENITKLPSRKDLYDYLHNKLPHYMIPAFYKQIESFPTNLNGKLDRKKLLAYPLESYSKELSEEILTENEQKLLALFKNVLSFNPGFAVSDDFFQHGGTSIQAMQLIAEVKNIFNKDIPFEHLHQNSSVKSLVRFLELENNQLLTGSLLSVLKEGDSQLPPVVFIHPAGGGLSYFHQLIKQLKFSNACFGIEDPLIQKSSLETLSMEEMAKNYLEHIKSKVNGPFILAGYSFGGMLALEMAAQLEQHGEGYEQNNLLGIILLDTWVVSCASDRIKPKLKEQVLAYCAEQRAQKAKAGGNQDPAEGSSTSIMDKLEEICRHHQEIGFAFKPEVLTRTPVRLLKASDLDEEFLEMGSEEKNNYLSEFIDKELFKKQEIEATHFNLLENPSLPEFFSAQVSELSQGSKHCLQKTISIKLSCVERSSGNAKQIFFNNKKGDNEGNQCENEKSMPRIAK
jgi:amino acid adenylation domain-containing protein/FkbH-like protein